ncbi:MAG TPA: histidine phosphatase family protein [Paracoccaceae bacterium]|nr:histidine phosphatase family protein [Paracoccaceae bacterium]
MRRLVLMRHAKSSWDDPALSDRARPLNRRGRLAAALMGALLREDDLVPDAALLSPALRVQETWAQLGLDAPAETAEALYMADPETQLAALRAAPDAARTLLMLGHEPGTTAFLRKLSDGTEPAGCRRAWGKVPTAALAVVELDVDWADAAFGAGRFRRFVAPKDLV